VLAPLVIGAAAIGCSHVEPPSCPCADPNWQARWGWTGLFDGKTLDGWEGDPDLWGVENGMLVGRSPGIQKNAFLCTTRTFQDFELRLSFRLVAGQGNSGIQFRSRKLRDHVSGYQADIGEGVWGCLYDAGRRNTLLAKAPAAPENTLDSDRWHEYVIRCEGPRIMLQLDGRKTADYVESEPDIEQDGIIALRLHAGPPMEIHFRDIRIRVNKTNQSRFPSP